MARKQFKEDFKSDKTNKKPYSNKGGRNKNTNKGRDNISQKTVPEETKTNDPAWYFTSPELANQAAQLSFQNVLGYGDIYGVEAPTIARINMAMCPGVTEAATENNVSPMFISGKFTNRYAATINKGKSGVNLMAAKLYTTLSSFTGRTASYAPQDVAMMVLGISAIAEWSEAIRRCFGIALTYNYRNRTLPLGLLRSMGLDTQDFISNLSIYRMRFNVAMSRINQIPLLENIAYIRKSRDIYQYIYMDDPTSMGQLFYYFPVATWSIDEKTGSRGTILRSHGVPERHDPTDLTTNAPATMGDWLEVLEDQITKILESSTLNFIYADLLNMANKVGVKTWQFDYLAENYVVMPIFNNNALLQFHNLNFTGRPFTTGDNMYHQSLDTSHQFAYTSGFDIFSDVNYNNVIYNPVFPIYSNATCKCHIIDMDTDQPTIEQRIEALRLHSAWSGVVATSTDIDAIDDISDDGYAGTTCWALPDHYPVEMYLYKNIDYSWNAALLVANRMVISSNVICQGSAVGATAFNKYAALTQFEHMPLFLGALVLESATTSTSAGVAQNVFGNTQFYTTVDYTYIRRLLEIMYVGLFDFRV